MACRSVLTEAESLDVCDNQHGSHSSRGLHPKSSHTPDETCLLNCHRLRPTTHPTAQENKGILPVAPAEGEEGQVSAAGLGRRSPSLHVCT